MKEAFQGKEKEWAKVIAQAWVDEEFKAKLLADPKAVLKAEGIEFPENIKLNIAEAKEDELNLTLPHPDRQADAEADEHPVPAALGPGRQGPCHL